MIPCGYTVPEYRSATHGIIMVGVGQIKDRRGRVEAPYALKLFKHLAGRFGFGVPERHFKVEFVAATEGVRK